MKCGLLDCVYVLTSGTRPKHLMCGVTETRTDRHRGREYNRDSNKTDEMLQMEIKTTKVTDCTKHDDTSYSAVSCTVSAAEPLICNCYICVCSS